MNERENKRWKRKNEIKSKLEKSEGKRFLRKINNTVSWETGKEIRLGRSSRVKWNPSYMCRTIGERPVTLTTTVQILISVCSGSSLLHLPRSSLKYPIYTYLQQVFIFSFWEYKEFIFLEGCQVSVYLEWKAGQLEIEWGQCLDSNLSQSKGCHRQPWRHRQRRMTSVFQWEPLKHLGVAILHGAPSFRVGPPARSCALRWPLPTQCE